jgi:cell wall-associated NlpC family hydrolase
LGGARTGRWARGKMAPAIATLVILRAMRACVPAALSAMAVLVAGCGQTQSMPGPSPQKPPSAVVSLGLHAHPQTIDPVAGAASSAPTDPNQPASVSVDSGAQLAQPVSDAVIRQELAQSGLTANSETAQLTPDGLAIAPANAPPQVQAVIAAGNEIARLPYRFGGGHGTFVDTAYDCSGSLSFAFAAAGILNRTMTSGELMNWGLPGRGKWITVFANGGHTFAYVAGLRFDTVARAETGSRWSNRSATERDQFAVRHPPGR